MNINSGITSEPLSTVCVLVVLKLKQLITTSCVAKIKLHMKAINYACFKLKEKTTRSVKKNKSNFSNIIGDKFAMRVLDDEN